MNSMLRLLVRDYLDDFPNYEEVQSAIGCLKCRKAAGESGILPELLSCGGPVIVDRLVDLFALVWRVGISLFCFYFLLFFFPAILFSYLLCSIFSSSPTNLFQSLAINMTLCT